MTLTKSNGETIELLTEGLVTTPLPEEFMEGVREKIDKEFDESIGEADHNPLAGMSVLANCPIGGEDEFFRKKKQQNHT